jgi:hypothetical protein
MDGKQKDKFLEAVDKLWAGTQAKSIYNADFGELTSYGLIRRLDEVREKLRGKIIEQLRSTNFADDSQGYGFYVNSIAKENRHWEKLASKYPEYAAFWKTVAFLPDWFKEMKGYIVKGRKPKEVDPSAPPVWQKPMIPVEAKKKAVEFLTQAVDQIRQDYYKSMTESFIKQAEALQKMAAEENWDRQAFMKKHGKSYMMQMADAAFARDNTYRLNAPLVANPDKDAVAAKAAKQTVDSILSDFIVKNSDKLGHIFAKKAVIKDHKIVYNRVQMGNLENGMFFAFDDGSSFTIYSSTVVGYTQRGAQFVKYPTRFTDVRMKDGSKMGMPSEEKMIKEF